MKSIETTQLWKKQNQLWLLTKHTVDNPKTYIHTQTYLLFTNSEFSCPLLNLHDEHKVTFSICLIANAPTWSVIFDVDMQHVVMRYSKQWLCKLNFHPIKGSTEILRQASDECQDHHRFNYFIRTLLFADDQTNYYQITSYNKMVVKRKEAMLLLHLFHVLIEILFS